jgi:hypothetical protein
MAKLLDGFKDGVPELGRRTFLVPESHSEVLALLYHEFRPASSAACRWGP